MCVTLVGQIVSTVLNVIVLILTLAALFTPAWRMHEGQQVGLFTQCVDIHGLATNHNYAGTLDGVMGADGTQGIADSLKNESSQYYENISNNCGNWFNVSFFHHYLDFQTTRPTSRRSKKATSH